MAEHISLEDLKTSLSQPNKAIRKRALAIIFNEEMIEAEELLKKHIGIEQDSELQVLSHKILQKLHDYQAFSETMDPEFVVPLLKSPDLGTRLRALRRLIKKKTPTLAALIQKYCPHETVPEAAMLIMWILNNNPHHSNLPLIVGFLDNPSPKVRMEAFKALLVLINGSLLPLFFKGLIDDSQEIQIMTMQMVNQFQRKNLLDALEQMLAGSPEISRLASRVFSQLHGSDLLPILKKYLNHADQTTALFLQTFYNHLGEKEKTPAKIPAPTIVKAQPIPHEVPPSVSKPVSKPLPVPTPESLPKPSHIPEPVSKPAPEPIPKPVPKSIPEPAPLPESVPTKEEFREQRTLELFTELSDALRQSWEKAPALFMCPMTDGSPPQNPNEIIYIIRNIFDRVRYVVAVASICLYFKKGNRLPQADKTCFQAIQRGMLDGNTLQLLQTLAPCFPEPSGTGDLFPIIISTIFRKDQDEAFFEPFLSLHEGLVLLDRFPEEAEKFIPPAIDSLSAMLKNFSGPFGANKLLVKQVLRDGTKVFDFLTTPPAQLDQKGVSTINLTHNYGILVSRNSLNYISLEPFLRYDSGAHNFAFDALDEHTLWEFLKKYDVTEAYYEFLAETGNG